MLKIDYLLTFICILIILSFFVFYNGSWYHIENLMAHQNSVGQIYDKGINLKHFSNIIFRGDYFDNNPSRFRPISHLFELFDHISNRKLISMFGNNLIINTPSNIIFLLCSTILLVKLIVKNKNLYFYLIIFILISSSFYLSNIYFLLRPSKKMAILLSFLTLYIIDNKNIKIKLKLYLVNISLFIGTICDEEFLLLIPVLSIIFLYNYYHKLSKSELKEYLYLNTIIILIYLYFVFFRNQFSYFNGVYHDLALAHTLYSGVNFELFYLYFSSLAKSFSYMIFGYNHFVLGILFLISIFLINKTYTKKLVFFKYEKFVFLFLVSILYLIFQSLLELIGGNIILRSIGYYYGSTKLIIFVLFIYLYKDELNLVFNKLHNKISKIIIYSTSITIILLNLQNFSYANKLTNYMHYKNIDVEKFNAQLSGLKQNNTIKYNWEELYIDKNHEEIFFELLNKLNIYSEYSAKLLESYDNMMPKEYVIQYEIFLKKNIYKN